MFLILPLSWGILYFIVVVKYLVFANPVLKKIRKRTFELQSWNYLSFCCEKWIKTRILSLHFAQKYMTKWPSEGFLNMPSLFWWSHIMWSFLVSLLCFPPCDERETSCSAVWHPAQPLGATGPLWSPSCSVLRFVWSLRYILWFDAWVAN